MAGLRSVALKGFGRSFFEGFEIVRNGFVEPSIEEFEMTKVRMSLAEAGERLGIAPNSVRSRWKAGKIEGARDNAGKIWVHLDPAEVAELEEASKPSIEPASKAPKESLSNPSKNLGSTPSIEAFEAGCVEAQAAHIETLAGQLRRATTELDELRPKLLEGERAQARAEALETTLSTLRKEREEERRSHREHVEDLRGRVERAERGEREVQAQLAASREEAERERGRGFWSRLRRGRSTPA